MTRQHCVAAAQYSPTASPDENFELLRASAVNAQARGAVLLVAPEYALFTEPKLGPRYVEHAESLTGNFVSRVRGLAHELGMAIVFGMNEAVDDPEKVSNTVVAVGADGSIAAIYRKLHLYDAFGSRESDVVLAGEITPPAIFAVGDLRVGLQTCYDVRFPEVTRRLVDAGAHVIAIPTWWVRGPLKEFQWRTLVQARAIENTAYIVAADQTPPTAIGNSMIVDPSGVVLAGAGTEASLVTAWLSLAEIDRVRTANPALELRRFTTATK